MDSKKIIKNAQALLVKTAEELQTLEIKECQEQIFHSSDFRNMEIFTEKNELNNNSKPIIYTIELLSINQKDKLVSTFHSFSTENKGKANRVCLSQDNTANNLSNYLYVGSSTTDFIGRLKYHFGVRKGNGLYSLHLSKWGQNLNYEVEVCTYKVIEKDKKKAEKVNNLKVEILEQQIWDQYKPLFGKRSGLG